MPLPRVTLMSGHNECHRQATELEQAGPLFDTAIGALLLFRRILYSLVLVVSLPVVWINGQIYLRDVRLGLAMRLRHVLYRRAYYRYC